MAKRAKVEVTKVPRGVRELWEQTAPEAQEEARQRARVLLEYWSGRKTKAQSAAELQLPPVRVWQLTKAGLSGMVVGLVKQPRRRRGGTMKSAEEKEIQRLRKANADLERRLQVLEQLIAVLHELPGTEAGKKKTAPGESKTSGRDPARSRTAKRRPRVAGAEAARECADAVGMGARGAAQSGASAADGGGASGGPGDRGRAAGGAGKNGESGGVEDYGKSAAAAGSA